MSEHTPGPWRIHATDETLVIGPDRYEIACMSGNYASDYEKMGANATLIAAAPEMYEALTNIHDWLMSVWTPEDMVSEGVNEEFKKAYLATRAALFKANGGER